jgi:hypothetical protein
MIQKKHLVVVTVATYAVLFTLFFMVQKNNRSSSMNSDSSCILEKPCVTFCCKNETLCNQKYINDNFNASLLPEDKFTGWNATQGIKAYFGKPNCTLDSVDIKAKWEFRLVIIA